MKNKVKDSMGLGFCLSVLFIVFIQTNADETGETLGSNRVLPVDAAHRKTISTPLAPHCVQTIKENLVKFLKRHPIRQARQDDGDDGDDGEGEGIGGLINNLQEGNGALSTLSMIPQVLPQIVNTLTMLSGSINMGLNGTDTPNIPSFLIRQSQEAVKFFQAIAGAAQMNRQAVADGPRAGPPGIPVNRGPKPPLASYEPYPGQVPGGVQQPTGNIQGSLGGIPPGLDEDYLDEDVKQHLQPTMPPLLRPGGGGNYNPGQLTQNQDLSGGGGGDFGGLPQGTSLWNIYKSFRTRPEGTNGSLTDFQLMHPEAFSNELLQSISMAISSVRGMLGASGVPAQAGPNLGSAPAGNYNKPNSEILKEVFNSTEPPTQPPPPPPQFQQQGPPSLSSIFSSANRPTLSVYKPNGAISNGLGLDLSNLALNNSQSLLNPGQKPKPEEEYSSGEDETTPHQPQLEVDTPQIGGQRLPKPTISTVVGTGSLEQLQAQNTQPRPGGPQFVKSPTSNHLTLQMGEYIPAISGLHEQDQSKVGPQVNSEDHKNGFQNKAPYTPVLNGILLEAPRLTPSPILENIKRPSNLFINAEPITEAAPEVATQFPGFQFQVDRNKPNLPPNYHGPDPTTQRGPTLNAAIPSKFEYDRQSYNPNSGLLPPGIIPKPGNPVPAAAENFQESSFIKQSLPEITQPPPAPPTSPPRRRQRPQQQLTPAQINAQRLLQQLVALQAILQQEQQRKQQQNLQILQNALTNALTTTTTTTTTTIPPYVFPPQDQIPNDNILGQAGYLPTKGGSSIASGLASALQNNLPPGTSLLNRPPYTGPAPPLGASTPILAEYSPDRFSNGFNQAPLRTTPRTPPTTSTLPTTTSPVRFQPFPSFPDVSGTNSQLVKEPQQQTSNTWGFVQTDPAVVQVTNPSLANVFNGGKDPSSLPETTPKTISGSFVPFQPFGSGPTKFQEQVVQPPSVKIRSTTTTQAPTTTPPKPKSTLPPALSSFNFARPAGGYFPSAGAPVSPGGHSNQSPSGVTPPPLPPPSPPKLASKPKPQDPYLIISNPTFQRPAQSGGYPQYIPSAPLIVTSSGVKSPIPASTSSPFKSPAPLRTSTAAPTTPFPSTAPPPSPTTALPTAPAPPAAPAPPKLPSAIAEMAKIPLYQEDTFIPSAISSTSLPTEDSFEEISSTSPPAPIQDLFSSTSNLSATSPPPPKPSTISLSESKFSAAEENDSAEEQPYPNFPPGKPVYWMNMYYPNGVPVLTKVQTTPEPTTPKPRKRRTRSTTTTVATTRAALDAEYYEDEEVSPEDGDDKKAKKKRRRSTTVAVNIVDI